MQAYDWTARFRTLYDKALEKYTAGQRAPAAFFSTEEQSFLQSIGARPVELFDFAEDAGGLDRETALLIAAARRDYFLVMQHGAPSDRRIAISDFPPKDAELSGIPWLPRLILKAKSRLR